MSKAGLGIYVVPKDKVGEAEKIILSNGCIFIGIIKHEDPEKVREAIRKKNPDPVIASLVLKLYKSIDEKHLGVVFVCLDPRAYEVVENQLDKLEGKQGIKR